MFPFRSICSLPVHCLYIRELKVIFVEEVATSPVQYLSAYTSRKVRAMRSIFSMDEVAVTLIPQLDLAMTFSHCTGCLPCLFI